MSIGVVLVDLVLLAGGLFLYHRWVTRQKKPSPTNLVKSGIEQELYGMSEELVTYFQATAHPEDLLRHSSFLRGVDLLLSKSTELMRYAQGDNAVLACMALEALSRHEGATEVLELLSGALVDQIREQPFSVVLLDEFEKSHPKIWDLFLQVFDDGRLTDACGSTADCRHAIFIMTSNLGSAIPTGLRVGFTREALAFNEAQVKQLIDKTRLRKPSRRP